MMNGPSTASSSTAGPNSQPQPDEATGYTFSKDHLTVTITLPEGSQVLQRRSGVHLLAVLWSLQQDLLPRQRDARGLSSFWPT